jgi:hypothetical protein
VDAQGDLSDSQKQQIQKENEAFKKKVKALAGDIGRSVSIEEAAKQLESDFAELATTYRRTLAPIDCG